MTVKELMNIMTANRGGAPCAMYVKGDEFNVWEEYSFAIDEMRVIDFVILDSEGELFEYVEKQEVVFQVDNKKNKLEASLTFGELYAYEEYYNDFHRIMLVITTGRHEWERSISEVDYNPRTIKKLRK